MLSREPVESPEFLLRLARSRPAVRTAVVKADQDIALESIRQAVEAGLAEPVLIGGRATIERQAAAIGWDISGFDLIDAADEREAAEAAAGLARDGSVGAIMKGHVHTDNFLKPIVSSKFGLRTDRRISHVFHMTVPGSDRALMITDGAINPHPDLETKKDILLNAVDLAHRLGQDRPRVAVLSATESVNPHLPSSIDADDLTAWAGDAVGNKAAVYGPLAFDLAVSPEAARIKGIDHPVAGRADVVLVPDIVSGNALFKMLVYYRSACAAGIVLGAKVPVTLTSRADPPAARLAASALAAVMAG